MNKYAKLALCFFIIFLLSGGTSKATHLLAFDGYTKCIGKTDSTIGLAVYVIQYREVRANQVAFDDTVRMGIYDRGTRQLQHTLSAGVSETVKIFDAPFMSFVLERRTFTATVWLKRLPKGYTFFSARCCLPTVVNVTDNQGFALYVEAPDKLETGEETFHLKQAPFYVVNRNMLYTFPHSTKGNVYDQVVIRTGHFYVDGSDNDPLPSLMPTLKAPQPNIFKANYSAQFPMGNTSTTDFNTSPDSFKLMAGVQGSYLLPYHADCILGGDTLVYNRIVYVIVTAFSQPALTLELNEVRTDAVTLFSQVIGVEAGKQVTLQRSTDSVFTLPHVVNPDVPYGVKYEISDTNVTVNTHYYYRLRAPEGNKFVYSNVVVAGVFHTGLETWNKAGLKVFPNPAAGAVKVVSEEATELYIYNTLGVIQWKGSLIAGENAINLDNLAAGVYLLKTGHGEIRRLVIAD